MSKELRECPKSLDAQMRVEMNESMLKAMNRMTGASRGKASSGKHPTQRDRKVQRKK
jgi:hypothetical protein